MEERIPDLSDLELERLYANASRLAQSGTTAQRGEADALLPIISAALEERRAVNAAAQIEVRKTAAQKRVVAAKVVKQKAKAP